MAKLIIKGTLPRKLILALTILLFSIFAPPLIFFVLRTRDRPITPINPKALATYAQRISAPCNFINRYIELIASTRAKEIKIIFKILLRNLITAAKINIGNPRTENTIVNIGIKSNIIKSQDAMGCFNLLKKIQLETRNLKHNNGSTNHLI